MATINKHPSFSCTFIGHWEIPLARLSLCETGCSKMVSLRCLALGRRIGPDVAGMGPKMKQLIVVLHGITSSSRLVSLLMAIPGLPRHLERAWSNVQGLFQSLLASYYHYNDSSPKADCLAKVSLVEEKPRNCGPSRSKKSCGSPSHKASFYLQMDMFFFTRHFFQKTLIFITVIIYHCNNLPRTEDANISKT